MEFFYFFIFFSLSLPPLPHPHTSSALHPGKSSWVKPCDFPSTEKSLEFGLAAPPALGLSRIQALSKEEEGEDGEGKKKKKKKNPPATTKRKVSLSRAVFTSTNALAFAQSDLVCMSKEL